eukprot:1138115-Pelagomonas_calceolata.AAC.2
MPALLGGSGTHCTKHQTECKGQCVCTRHKAPSAQQSHRRTETKLAGSHPQQRNQGIQLEQQPKQHTQHTSYFKGRQACSPYCGGLSPKGNASPRGPLLAKCRGGLLPYRCCCAKVSSRPVQSA